MYYRELLSRENKFIKIFDSLELLSRKLSLSSLIASNNYIFTFEG